MVSKFTRVTLSGTVNSTGDIDINSDKAIRGKVQNVRIEYPSNNVAVKLQTAEPVPQTILDLSIANTDAVYYPRKQVEDDSGSGVTYDGSNGIYEPFVVFGKLNLVCSSGTDGDDVRVTAIIEEY